MFSAHWSCDGLFVLNELHHMVMTFMGYERIAWKVLRKRKMTRIELDQVSH